MALIRKNGLFRGVAKLTLILGFLLAGWTAAFGYVGQSLQELQAQAEELTIPPDSILQEVKKKELPGTLFLMGFQDDLLVFFVLYEGSCVREWYVNLTLQKGPDRLGQIRDHPCGRAESQPLAFWRRKPGCRLLS